jgi:hypothetical protein
MADRASGRIFRRDPSAKLPFAVSADGIRIQLRDGRDNDVTSVDNGGSDPAS